MGRILKTNNMKKKIIIAFVIILTLFSAIIIHELLCALSQIIPYPISLGMIGGFSLGFFVAMKN